MNQIKVLYFCPTPNMYGDNIALLRIMPYLEKKGIDPYFLVAANSQAESEFISRGYKTLQYKDMYSTLLSKGNLVRRIISGIKKIRLLDYKKNISCILPEIQKLNPDLIHSNTVAAGLGYIIAKKINRPHVWHIREYGILDIGSNFFPSKSFLRHQLCSINNYNITITKDVKDYFQLNDENSTFVYDGPLNDENCPTIIPNKEPYFLFVGRILSTKGVHDAIEAFGMFHRQYPIYHLYVLGDSNDVSYKNILNKNVDNYNIRDFVHFEGYCNNPQKWMLKASALIVPSRFEAFGFITAEAHYYGCPVIGRDTGGTKEQLDNIANIVSRINNLRFNNVDDLVSCMQYVIANPFTKTELTSIQQRVKSLYSSSSSANRLFNVYSKILSL